MQSATRFRTAFLRALAPALFFLPAFICVAEGTGPPATARRIAADIPPLTISPPVRSPRSSFRQPASFHFEYQVQATRGDAAEDEILSWRYPTAEQAATRLKEFQSETDGHPAKLTHICVARVQIADPPAAFLDFLAQRLRSAQERVDAASSSAPSDHYVSEAGLPQLATFLERFTQASAAVHAVLTDFANCINGVNNTPRRFSPNGERGFTMMTDAHFAIFNRLIASFNSTASQTFVLSTKAKQIAPANMLAMLSQLSSGSLAIPAAGYVVTTVLKSGVFATGRFHKAQVAASSQIARRVADYDAAYYTRYFGSENNRTVVRTDPIYAAAQLIDAKAVDRFAARNADEIRQLPNVPTTNLNPLVDSTSVEKDAVWVTFVTSDRPFPNSRSRYAYRIHATQSEAEKLAKDWTAQGLKPVIQRCKHGEAAIRGFLASDVRKQLAEKSLREEQTRLALRTSLKRERHPHSPAHEKQPPSSEVVSPEAARPEPLRPDGGRRSDASSQQPRAARQPGSVAGTIWKSDTNSEEFVFESDGRFIRRWDFGHPIVGECDGRWTQDGNEIIVNEAAPCHGQFAITYEHDRIKVHNPSGKFSVFRKR